ncbi:uncharacterized protein DUF4350 [Winogradskyella epiphytica]|uniref:Uncharacterized protein DUF4350 n=1 Tax=Winogradskyella epiphytica TaxID=262005 RepID=A0A2V4WXQ4_9FLAO|nr:DUF4350 domain-containing protein [Winogradskyella epiphytica]PYE82036.1 uncharacterized protein DUF4350 [Winogradskyella epiphytica]GGW60923.1 hypothetical protein GCM10008085_10580 [Winogradskyella epiphytica]
MSKKGKTYIILVALTLFVIVALEMSKPKQINWFPSYATHHKIPFGSYVFNQELNRLADNVSSIDRPPFEYLNENNIEGTYLFYNGDIEFGKEELNSLLDWVNKGNTLVVSSANFEKKLLDTLNLTTTSVNTFGNFNNEYQVKLVNPLLDDSKTYKYDRPTTFFHFNKIDTLQTSVLSFIDTYRGENKPIEDSLINSIKQPFGDGEIMLSTFPQAFSNYFILKTPNQNYTAGFLSYIDTSKPIYVDTFHKSGKVFYTSPLYLFLNTKSLKWAYYMVLIGAVIYIIFEGKRKQRAIPVVKPLRNQTVGFTRTIANMYYESGKHKDISNHKIQHFQEYIRNTLHLSTAEINTSFIKNLAARSNNTIEDTQELFEFIDSINHKTEISKVELERLNSLIEKYKSL